MTLVSLSETIFIGIPCNRTNFFHIFSANTSVDCATLYGMKCADLVSRSIITQIVLFPFGLRGKAVTKSIVTCSHFHSDIDNGCKGPDTRWCLAFTSWQTKHLATYCVISLFTAFH